MRLAVFTLSYISPTEALTTFLYDNWHDCPVCYPNTPAPDLDDESHWLRVYAFQSSSQTTLSESHRVTDNGLFYIDVVGEPDTGTAKHTALAGKLAAMLQAKYVNGVSLQSASIAPESGYDAEGRYVVRVIVEYVVDYEY